MKTNLRILGALLVAVVGGCAGTRSTVVPLTPVALGTPVDASSYDLTVDGAPGGRVLLKEGQAVRDRGGQELIKVGMEIDNRTSDRTFRLPTDQIWLSNLGPQSAKLIEVDSMAAPSAIEVPPGETHSFELTFMPARPVVMHKIAEPQVHWTLLIDGASEPVARTTSFVALRNVEIPGQRTASRNWDLPSRPDNGRWDRLPNEPANPTSARTTGHIRPSQELPSGL